MMRVSIREENNKKSNVSDITGTTLPKRWGQPEEDYVKDYLAYPTQVKRDYIVALCDRFIRSYYADLHIPDRYKEFRQAAIVRILEIIDSYDPSKGSMCGWVMLCLEGFTRTYRFKIKRDRKTQIPSGFQGTYNTASEYFDAYQSYVDVESGVIRSLDKGTIHTILDELVIRFCTQPEIAVCKFSVDFLKQHGRFPTFRQIHARFFQQLSLSLDELYFMHTYFKIVCHLHFVRWLKEDARER